MRLATDNLPNNVRQTNHAERFWLLLLALTFFGYSAFFVLGEYQTLTGDMAQYITHARNLLWDRPWAFLMHMKPTVLFGYPLVLTAPLTFFGANVYAIALMNSLFWIGTVACFYLIYREKLSLRWRWAYLACLMFYPYIISFQQEAQPNIFYGFSTALALWATYNLLHKPPMPHSHTRLGIKILLYLAFIWPACVRQDSMALYLAVACYCLFTKRYRFMSIALFGFALTIALDLWLSNKGTLSGFGVLKMVGTQSAGSGAPLVPSIAYMFLKYQQELVRQFFTEWPRFLPFTLTLASDLGLVIKAKPVDAFTLTTNPFEVGVILTLWIGFFRNGLRISPDRLFFLGHLAMLSLFLLVNNAPSRYLIPIAPIGLFYVMQGASWMIEKGVKENARELAVFLAICVFGYQAFKGSYDQRLTPERFNQLYTAEMHDAMAWIAAHDHGAGVAFYKDRIVTMLLDSPAVTPDKKGSLPAALIYTPHDLKKLEHKTGMLILLPKREGGLFQQVHAELQRETLFQEMYENAGCWVYRVR